MNFETRPFSKLSPHSIIIFELTSIFRLVFFRLFLIIIASCNFRFHMKRNIWPFVIISVTLCLFLIVFKPWSSGSSRNEPQTLAASSEPSPQTSTASANVSRAVPPSLSPYELFLKTKPDGIREVIEPEVEIRWQRPLEGVKLRAVALLFHGCTHNANHFFQLPEDRTVVRWLLAYGFAVVAISSADAAPAGSGCWCALFCAFCFLFVYVVH